MLCLKTWSVPALILDALLLAAIVTQAIIYSRQLHQMRIATRAAANAAQRAKDSIDQVERNSHLDQRAWVTVTYSQLLKPLTPNERPSVKIAIKNSGKTPALKVHAFAEVYVAPAPKKIVESGPSKSVTIIGPNSEHISTVDANSIVDQADIDSVANEWKSLYANGTIYYCDIFKMRHWTTFCVHIEGRGLNAPQILLEACPEGNTVDEKSDACPEEQ